MQSEFAIDAMSAEDHVLICENSDYVGYVSERWRTGASFLVSQSQVGKEKKMRDPIGDLFSRIKNGVTRRKEVVDMYSSNFKEEVSRLLFEEGFISKYEVLTRGGKKLLRLTLKYGLDKYGKPNRPLIKEIKQVSKPGKRVYSEVAKIPRIQSGFGMTIVSTPSGVMSGDMARKKKIGGEIVAYVY